MADYNDYKRRRDFEDAYTGGGRGRERNFGNRGGDNRRSGYDRPDGGDRGRYNGGHDCEGNFRFRNSGRGGPSSFRGGFGSCDREGFRKTAGGDFSRMPESTAYKQLVCPEMAHGTEGTSIDLLSNFYQILHTGIQVRHYDINISKVCVFLQAKKNDDPTSIVDGDDGKHSSTSDEKGPELSEDRKLAQERFIKKFADKILDNFVKDNSDLFSDVPYVYDGCKNLYTTVPIKFSGEALNRNVEVNIDGTVSTFRITLCMVDRVSMADAIDYYEKKTTKPISERIISIFDIIFRFVIGKSYAIYQRKLFDLDQVESSKAKIVDFLQGFINSVRMTEFGLALNVHLKTSCIISKSYNMLFMLVCRILNMETSTLISGIDKRQLFQVNKIIRHLKMFTKHSKKVVTYTIDCIVDKYPSDVVIQHKDKKITIYDFFKNEYDIHLKKLPMVRASGKNNVHLPLELCYLKEAQFLNMTKFDQNIQREILFKSTHTPNVYFHKVAKIVNRIKDSDTAGVLKQFGIDINSKAAMIQGRVLPAPRNLSSNQKDRFFNCPTKAPIWGLFCFDNRQFKKDDLKNFIGQIKQNARQFGLLVDDPSFYDCVKLQTLEDIKNIFHKVNKRTNAEMIFVGIPTRHDSMQSCDIYNMVKHCCDQKYGIISQCFKADILRNPPRGYFDNFLLKVNGKIGGQNTCLDSEAFRSLPFAPDNTMVVGVDVNHPGQTERVISSIAAAVGSYDNTFSRYNASIRMQCKERDELVKQLDEMIADLLQQYNKANNRFPKNLIVFRDGVSEGQFAKVVEIEIPLIKRAFNDVVGTAINLVFIVVQKRHHTRFALAQQNDQGQKLTYNVPSGTIVDKGIVDPHLKIFYLNSHFSPLGTSKPTKYVILKDDLNLTADQVQKFCFYSCFNNTRTRKVIAIPTAVRYADLCAYRSKVHIEAQRADLGDTRSNFSGSSGRLGTIDPEMEQSIIRKLNKQVKLHERVKHQLFYC